MTRRRPAVVVALVATLLLIPVPPASAAGAAFAQETATEAALPALTGAVNDLAKVLDPAQAAEITRMSGTLQAATGDVVVVVTVPTFAPYGSIQEYAVKLFENQGRGIGERGKDNGLLVLLAAKDRQVWIEVGYGLEGFITDGFSGETSRQYMVPFFRNNQYGEGLKAGVARLIARIAEGRKVSLEGVRPPDRPPQAARQRRSGGIPLGVWIFLVILAINVLRAGFGGGGRRRGRGPWGGGPWSGWSGGVGPFGGGAGGWGGGFGGGGFGGGGGGGGFGGFGGGRSGGGGGGASW